MEVVSFEQFKEIFLKMPNNSEYELYFADTKSTYSIVKYADSVSFARCGYSEELIKETGIKTDYIGTDEDIYTSFDAMVSAELVDGINISRDWQKITDILVNGTFSIDRDLVEIKQIYFGTK